MLVPPRNPNALIEALDNYLADPDLRKRHGAAGRERIVRHFQPRDSWLSLEQAYVELWQGHVNRNHHLAIYAREKL